MYVNHRFDLEWGFVKSLSKEKPKFGYNGFGEFVFYRTYSRTFKNGQQESWADVVIRVTQGIFSIRKDWYLRNYIYWDESYWQKYAQAFAKSLFDMHWFPGGRGLWAMGTNYIYERGAMALYNCAFVDLDTNLPNAYAWLMDALMNGVGVGFSAYDECPVIYGNPTRRYTFTIEDSREGWCESVRALLNYYFLPNAGFPLFDYSKIRPKGQPIKGFGGIASGPEPLKKLHGQIEYRFMDHQAQYSKLKTDIANLIGCCVVSGNVRRSAEIAIGSVQDSVFLDLKNYSINPKRELYGWMSNNSVALNLDSDFEYLGEIARRVKDNGEPGYINLRNFKFGRLGHNDNVRKDEATGINPCGEIPLESYEVCNLAETCPTNCTPEQWLKACEYATFYCSTVALLPTHLPDTNIQVMKNRRIGVGIIDVSGWKEIGVHAVTRFMRQGYKKIREVNKKLAEQAGVPESIRVTTIKPGGTVPKLVGKTPGIGHPTSIHTLRRVRISENSPIVDILKKAHVPYERDVVSDNTLVFEFPILQGPAKSQKDVGVWEQAANIIHAQREWSDNAVSNTITFKESDDLEPLLSFLAPLTKSVSLLPSDDTSYEQMPEQEISIDEYEKRVNDIAPINWEKLTGSDGFNEKYCDGDVCQI